MYDKISLADVYIGTCFVACFQTIFDAGMRNGMPHLAKWFERFTKNYAVVESFGIIKMCSKAIKPAAGGPPSGAPADSAPAKKGGDAAGGKADSKQAKGGDAKGGKKKEKKPVIAQSLVMFEIKPEDAETNLDEVAKAVLAIKKDGLYWKTEYKKEPVAFGIYKLLMGVTVEDEKISVDGLQEQIEELKGVQSVDILAFNKI